MHIKRVTSEQQQILLSWLEKNPDIATGRQRGPCCTSSGLELQWSAIARKLNDRGVEKDVKKWQQVWRDWKGNVRKKQHKLQQESKEKNEAANTNCSLSTFEQRILALLSDDNNQSHGEALTHETIDNIIKEEPLGIEHGYSSESVESLHADESCSWELPSPAAVVVTPLGTANNDTSDHRASHSRRQDPLRRRISTSKLSRRVGNTKWFRLRSRQLQLERRRLNLEREQLAVQRTSLNTLDRLTDVLTRLTHIAERFQARWVDR